MAKPFNIDSLLGKPKNRVAKIGVELEGVWSKLPDGTKLEHDGSVFRNKDVPPGWKKGELPLGPMLPGALSKFMKKYYPHRVDETCGMHVHMSFSTLLRYSWLTVPEYQETIIEYLRRWATTEGFPPEHHIWMRLAGASDFCQKKFWPDLQINYGSKDHNQVREGHRYTIVHYCGRQQTIEIRVLPMMDTVDQSIRAIKHVIAITNACLLLCAKREAKIVQKLEFPADDVETVDFEQEIPLTSWQRQALRTTL